MHREQGGRNFVILLPSKLLLVKMPLLIKIRWRNKKPSLGERRRFEHDSGGRVDVSVDSHYACGAETHVIMADRLSASRFQTSLLTSTRKGSWVHIRKPISPRLPVFSESLWKNRKALRKNKTCELVIISKGRKAIDCIWVYWLKRDANWNMEIYRAQK